MTQDWKWWCSGCGKGVEPYESHDIEECYQLNGKEMPEDKSTPLGAMVVFILISLAIWLVFK